MHSVRLNYTLNHHSDKESSPPDAALLRHPLMDLLQAVAQQGSISAAARQLNLSYRHVWGELKRWEEVMGHELIVWEKGVEPILDCDGREFALLDLLKD